MTPNKKSLASFERAFKEFSTEAKLVESGLMSTAILTRFWFGDGPFVLCNTH